MIQIFLVPYQGLIQDFLLGGGGNHIFENFLDIFGQQTDEFSYNNFSNSTIDQFKYSHFVYLPVYHIH